MTTPDLTSNDLRDAKLRGANLCYADLRGKDLSRADLRGANLRGADLRKTRLVSANLSGANLVEANLASTYLPWADLSGADLSMANLAYAQMTDANLRSATFYRADLRGAILAQANMTSANLWQANLDNALFRYTVVHDTYPLRSLGETPSGSAIIWPTPSHGWQMAVGCWRGSPDALRHLVAQDADWPEARGDQVAERRPFLLHALELADWHMHINRAAIDELVAEWGKA